MLRCLFMFVSISSKFLESTRSLDVYSYVYLYLYLYPDLDLRLHLYIYLYIYIHIVMFIFVYIPTFRSLLSMGAPGLVGEVEALDFAPVGHLGEDEAASIS